MSAGSSRWFWSSGWMSAGVSIWSSSSPLELGSYGWSGILGSGPSSGSSSRFSGALMSTSNLGFLAAGVLPEIWYLGTTSSDSGALSSSLRAVAGPRG